MSEPEVEPPPTGLADLPEGWLPPDSPGGPPIAPDPGSEASPPLRVDFDALTD